MRITKFDLNAKLKAQLLCSFGGWNINDFVTLATGDVQKLNLLNLCTFVGDKLENKGDKVVFIG